MMKMLLKKQGGIRGFGGERALLKDLKEDRRKGIFDRRRGSPWGLRYEVGAGRRNALKLFRTSVKSKQPTPARGAAMAL
jgi:hypothetical protein